MIAKKNRCCIDEKPQIVTTQIWKPQGALYIIEGPCTVPLTASTNSLLTHRGATSTMETFTPSFSLFTLLLCLAGVVLPGYTLASPHLKKVGCPITKDMPFPSSVKVSLNISGQSHVSVGDVRRRSTSPWDYSQDINYNRIPSIITEAKCRHDGCVDAEGSVDLNLNSVPIRQEILVLHREMKGCVPTFKLEKKLVTVGCTCAQPTMEKQS
ncbi:interleukin-17A-like [Rana temporaria]|uniref:interleukin-17A-like n=1 Tax=Rana temporaria TaxID=8407 RepID=UPI001AACDA8E|nr:interleukin-17A-like [Rana temporaria]